MAHVPEILSSMKEIKREYYLNQLISSKQNGLIKIVTGIRRCGKSYLLRTLFKKYLLEQGVSEDHIIEMAFDLYDNIEFRNPKVFYPWVKEKLQDGGFKKMSIQKAIIQKEMYTKKATR